MHLVTLTSIFPWCGRILYKDFPAKKMTIEVAIKTAGRPNPSGKQSNIPIHLTFSRRSGVTSVEMKDPKLIEK